MKRIKPEDLALNIRTVGSPPQKKEGDDKSNKNALSSKELDTQYYCDTQLDCQTNIYCDTVDGCETGVCDTNLTKCSACDFTSKCEEETDNCQDTTRKCGDTITKAVYCCALTEEDNDCVGFTKQCEETEFCLETEDSNCNTKAMQCVPETTYIAETVDGCSLETKWCAVSKECEATSVCPITGNIC